MHNSTVNLYEYLTLRSREQSGLLACKEKQAICERLSSNGGAEKGVKSSGILGQIHRKGEVC